MIGNQRDIILKKMDTDNFSHWLIDAKLIKSAPINDLLFYTDDKVYKSRSTIKKILSELSESTFVQTHRAYIINKKKIEKRYLS